MKGKQGFQKGHPSFVKEWNKKQKGIHYSLSTEFKKGTIPWNKNKTGYKTQPWSVEHRKKMERIWENKSREFHKTTFAHRLKRSKKWKEWRKAIFEKDKYICQDCGKHGDRIEPHHKISFAKLLGNFNIKSYNQAMQCKELWDINNGIALCHKCHKKTDNYGRNKN